VFSAEGVGSRSLEGLEGLEGGVGSRGSRSLEVDSAQALKTGPRIAYRVLG
jgi:hypothetical protein